MKDFLLKLKRWVEAVLHRDPKHLRLIALRDRVTRVLLFLDNHFFRMLAVIGLGLFLFLVF
mgnify:CR=1 FL=1